MKHILTSKADSRWSVDDLSEVMAAFFIPLLSFFYCIHSFLQKMTKTVLHIEFYIGP